MNYSLIVFSCVAALTLAGRGGGHGGRGGHGFFPPPPPFLQNATAQARRDFFQIVSNENATKAEIKTSIDEWATTNNLSAEVTTFENEVKSKMEEHKQNVTEAIGQLQTAFNELAAIEEDQSLTRAETFEQIKEKLDSSSPQLRAFLFAAAPHFGGPKGPKGHGGTGGGRGHGGFGGNQGGFGGQQGGFRGQQGGFGRGQGGQGFRNPRGF